MNKEEPEAANGVVRADKQAEGEDDLRARFPDVDTDERLRVARGAVLPEVPQIVFQRPTLPQIDLAAKSAPLRNLSGDLRGAGVASTIGLSLMVAILVGTGLGWLADTYLLHKPATPWGLITGFFVGTITGFINLIRTANRLNRDDPG